MLFLAINKNGGLVFAGLGALAEIKGTCARSIGLGLLIFTLIVLFILAAWGRWAVIAPFILIAPVIIFIPPIIVFA